MSTPPPGGWPPPQQPLPPPNQGQPYGQQGFNPEQSPVGWQQGNWPQQPGPPPPPQKGNSLKWLLIAVAVLLVIGISVGATLLFTRGGGGGGTTTPTSTSGAPSDIASAGDTGPIAVITEEPTCTALSGLNSALADVQANGWSAERATIGPAGTWTPEQRSHVQAVASAMKNASDQMVSLAKTTPHRVVRELYEQFIAYGRAYADRIHDYQPSDDALASANVSIGSALLGICDAIQYGSARRSLAIEVSKPPTSVAKVGDVNNPAEFVQKTDPTCASWIQRESKFIDDTAAWGALDTKLTSAEWTPDQRTIQLAVLPILATMADDMEVAGRASGNPVLEDFAVLGSAYFRAYVSAGENYTQADSWLSFAGSRLNNAVGSACSAVAG